MGPATADAGDGRAPASTTRFDVVDALRGFALFGVFWANSLIFAGLVFMSGEQRDALDTSPLDGPASLAQLVFVENKFIGLFSVLFGISFWLFLGRAAARGGSPTALFYRRIFWLLVFGLAHGWLLWCFDILRFYALWAVLLPLFVRTRPRRLLGAALGAAIVLPAAVSAVRAWVGPSAPAIDYDAMALAAFSSGSYRDVLLANWRYDWYLTASIGQIGYQVAVFGRLLLGLYIARTFDFGRLQAWRPLLVRVAVAGGLVGVVGNGVFAGDLFANTGSPLLAFVRRLVLESGYLGFTLAYATAFAVAFDTVGGRRALSVLAPVGRMALTFYLAQTVIGVWIYYGFAPGPRLMGDVGPAAILGLCVLGFAAQMVAARWWLQRFRFGPAEWLWRTLTYGRRQPLRLSPPASMSSGGGTPAALG